MCLVEIMWFGREWTRLKYLGWTQGLNLYKLRTCFPTQSVPTWFEWETRTHSLRKISGAPVRGFFHNLHLQSCFWGMFLIFPDIFQYEGFLKWGYPQLSSIFCGSFHEINHPAIGVPHDYGIMELAMFSDDLPIFYSCAFDTRRGHRGGQARSNRRGRSFRMDGWCPWENPTMDGW